MISPSRTLSPLLILAAVLTITPVLASHETSERVSINTGKPVYTYGDRLSFTVTVSNVTGDAAVLKIIDQQNRSSSPVNILIEKPTSNFTAPIPFYRTTFAPGQYHIALNYSGATAVTSFQIVDMGRIAIPPEFKVAAGSWAQNQSSTGLFADHILELVHSGIIQTKEQPGQQETEIPAWFKNVAKWWSAGLVPDEDFGNAIQFLINSNIIKISNTAGQ
ncbi:MAG: hypothetical protein KGI33_01060 [Thaumarchaeota archaeon]|nr:hypothetical protein [Nitrososphaerota archaeon]